MGNIYSEFGEYRFNDDGISTHTSKEQIETENECKKFYAPLDDYDEKMITDLKNHGLLSQVTSEPKLQRHRTVAFINNGLKELSHTYTCLDASRPWLIYWMIHALELLGNPPTEMYASCINTLTRCQLPNGGFGGGIGQYPHTAATYATVLSLVTIGTEDAYRVIDRKKLYQFFMRTKDPRGGFRVQDDGEMDTRGLYTVLAVASLTNMLTPELIAGCAEFVGRCQSFEGGIGGEPGNEAHGGYTFCGLAALVILKRFDTVNLEELLQWITTKQMRAEGGFQGRTNKLVDSCYSFWQGGVVALLHIAMKLNNDSFKSPITGDLIFNQTRLQQYVLLCCQHYEGGLRDKPNKHRDFYHTCYALSGLSLAQHHGNVSAHVPNVHASDPLVWGDESNELVATDPIYNVTSEKLAKAQRYFSTCEATTHDELMK